MALKPKRILYSDITRNLDLHPISEDLVRLTNENAIKESIKNLLLIDRGELLFQPEVGSDIRKMLFENATPDTFKVVEDLVETTITNHEPRCSVIKVEVRGDVDSHTMQITVIFNIVNSQKPISISLFLDRVR